MSDECRQCKKLRLLLDKKPERDQQELEELREMATDLKSIEANLFAAHAEGIAKFAHSSESTTCAAIRYFGHLRDELEKFERHSCVCCHGSGIMPDGDACCDCEGKPAPQGG